MTPTMHTPAAAPTHEAGSPPHEAAEQPQKTVRVPVVYPPPTASAPVHTPPPAGDRKLSRSVFNDTTADESGIGLRVGDTFLGFKLVEVLGEGAFARVFLAHQQSLAGRPVALKVTLRPTREADRLARLQHTNVVPVYSVHDAPPAQVICMPYLGRRTIADVIRAFRADHPSREMGRRTSGTRAARTTDVVDSGSASKSPTLPTPQPRATFASPGDGPNFIGDPAAVLPILAHLAAGLAHAHERGILHLDLKPANVLLPDIGEPMLLDFNLSFDTTTADRELVGGTVPYMATEQLLDLRSRGRGHVDARTDLYSLGVMAFEMLAGTVPFPAASRDLIDMDGLIAVRRQGPPSLRAINPAVSPAVESIVHKLLAPEPRDRYQSAGELKLDIERHLNNLPLATACERSTRERFQKWRRRNPGLARRMFAAAIFGLAIGLGAVMYQKQEAAANTEAAARAQTTRAAMDTVRLDLVLPSDAAARARGIAKAEELLEAQGLPANANWAKRPDVKRLSEQDRAALGADLGELLLLLAQAKWREADAKAGPARAEAARAALKLNRAALACFPAEMAPPLLDRQADELAFAAEKSVTPVAADREPAARDRFLDASNAITRSKFAEALSLLDTVVKEQPNHGAAQFCLAYCRQQLVQNDRALERYDVAERLLPGDARPSFQRGVIYATQLNQKDAEKEYSKSIALDRDHTYANRNRGFSRFRIGEELVSSSATTEAAATFKLAEEDLTKALELGAPAIQIHSYRHQVRKALGDAAGAEADARAAAKLTPKHEADFIARGNARIESDPAGALADLKEATRLNPRSLVAQLNQIHILGEKLNKADDALEVAARVAEQYPEYGNGRAVHAVMLARCGRRLESHREAEAAIRISKNDPEVSYRAACVFSITSISNEEDVARAVEQLDRAIKSGYRKLSTLKGDSDLDPIRSNEKFQKLLDAASDLFK